MSRLRSKLRRDRCELQIREVRQVQIVGNRDEQRVAIDDFFFYCGGKAKIKWRCSMSMYRISTRNSKYLKVKGSENRLAFSEPDVEKADRFLFTTIKVTLIVPYIRSGFKST